jgi:hypothetical protein
VDQQLIVLTDTHPLLNPFTQLEKYAKVVSDCEKVVELEPKSGTDL